LKIEKEIEEREEEKHKDIDPTFYVIYKVNAVILFIVYVSVNVKKL